jgi:signal-transduction protein with cAMP-binding, CBS, and nucleotidyltransferase domain
VQSDQSIADAARAMRDNAVGSVLVVRGDTLCGLVTDRDIVVRALAESALPDSPVGEVCSPDLVAVNADDDADEAAQVMRENAVRRLPVMDVGRQPVLQMRAMTRDWTRTCHRQEGWSRLNPISPDWPRGVMPCGKPQGCRAPS